MSSDRNVAETVSSSHGHDRLDSLQSGCAYRLSTISMERMAATEPYPTSFN